MPNTQEQKRAEEIHHRFVDSMWPYFASSHPGYAEVIVRPILMPATVLSPSHPTVIYLPPNKPSPRFDFNAMHESCHYLHSVGKRKKQDERVTLSEAIADVATLVFLSEQRNLLCTYLEDCSVNVRGFLRSLQEGSEEILRECLAIYRGEKPFNRGLRARLREVYG